jgi:hypothetical protein
MSLEDALDFIRNADPDTWGYLIREMKLTRKRRNLESLRTLRIGDHVLFAGLGASFEGYVKRLSRSGSVVLEVAPTREVPEGLISVPAACVKRVA